MTGLPLKGVPYMNPNDNKNNKNNKPGGNWRGVASLVGWALLLTIIFSYASSVMGSRAATAKAGFATGVRLTAQAARNAKNTRFASRPR